MRGHLTCALMYACALTASLTSVAADDTRTRTLHPDFRTLRVEKEGAFMDVPVINTAAGERVVVSFDEIGDDRSELQYRLIHCDASWNPSRLVESEYLDGFNIADLEDWAFSSNTYVHYVNYRLAIPSEDMRPLVSGNYLVQVFDRDDPDTTLVQARFSVCEDAVAVIGEASGRTDRGLNTEWQQLELTIDPGDFPLANPYQDLMVTVRQNGMPESERTLKAPLRMDGRRIVYAHAPELIFPASNEFRRFETVRLDYPGMHVDSTTFGGTNYHAWLMTDTDRSERQYAYDSTQRGRFMVRDYYSSDPDLGADYVTVHFRLDFPELTNGDLYLDGDLTGHLREEPYRMVYDRQNGAYTLRLPLKQGSYNYRYVAVPHMRTPGAAPVADPGVVEGNHYETSNEYEVFVWYRAPGARADRLLGHALILSRN